MIIHKQSFLLLEVIIAFFLVVMCIIPLLAPHAFILTEQKKFINKMELDHLVNLIYADIVERMYTNDLNWADLTGGREMVIDEAYLSRIQYARKLPYQGSYRFEEIKHKPLKESPRTRYVFKLNINFVPTGIQTKDKDGNIVGTLNYHYDQFVVRDLQPETPSTPTAPPALPTPPPVPGQP